MSSTFSFILLQWYWSLRGARYKNCTFYFFRVIFALFDEIKNVVTTLSSLIEFSMLFLFFSRFKHHLFDLTYIEKIARWLTNTQVKVKSEVSCKTFIEHVLWLATVKQHDQINGSLLNIIRKLVLIGHSYVFQVAFSNSQAKKLAVFMSTFDRHIDAVEKPNLDKDVSKLLCYSGSLLLRSIYMTTLMITLMVIVVVIYVCKMMMMMIL